MNATAGECECEFDATDGSWTNNMRFITVHNDNAAQCQLACCYRSLGCVAFTYLESGFGPPNNDPCKLWIDLDGTSPAPTPGAQSGKLQGAHCTAPPGVDPNHAPVPLLMLVSAGWLLLIVLGAAAAGYLVVGTFLLPERGRLPHARFWAELAGLVRDGISFALRGGQGGIASTNGSAGPKAAGAGAGERQGAGLSEALLGEAQQQATRGTPTPLHIAAQLGDAQGLAKLLQAGQHALDAGDGRRYTAYHCACAGGHVECARLLAEAGCDTRLLNDVGLTARQLAAQLKRTAVVAMEPSPASPTRQGFQGALEEKAVVAPNLHPSQAKIKVQAERGKGQAGAGGIEESRSLKAALKAR